MLVDGVMALVEITTAIDIATLVFVCMRPGAVVKDGIGSVYIGTGFGRSVNSRWVA
jgi:hypothetical protein